MAFPKSLLLFIYVCDCSVPTCTHEPQLGAMSVQAGARNLLLPCYERYAPPGTSHNGGIPVIITPATFLSKFKLTIPTHVHHSKLFTTIIILAMASFNLLFKGENIYENSVNVFLL